MSMTVVPISMRLVLAPTAASSGNGEPSWRAKWCTRKYSPSAPNSSGRNGEINGLQKRVGCRPRLRVLGEGVNAGHRQKTDFFMGMLRRCGWCANVVLLRFPRIIRTSRLRRDET